MRRASLLVACFATFCSPAFAQSRQTENQPIARDVPVFESDRTGERDTIGTVVVVAEPVVQQKTRSLVSRSSSKSQIDFNIPWQTGIYQ